MTWVGSFLGVGVHAESLGRSSVWGASGQSNSFAKEVSIEASEPAERWCVRPCVRARLGGGGERDKLASCNCRSEQLPGSPLRLVCKNHPPARGALQKEGARHCKPIAKVLGITGFLHRRWSSQRLSPHTAVSCTVCAHYRMCLPGGLLNVIYILAVQGTV